MTIVIKFTRIWLTKFKHIRHVLLIIILTGITVRRGTRKHDLKTMLCSLILQLNYFTERRGYRISDYYPLNRNTNPLMQNKAMSIDGCNASSSTQLELPIWITAEKTQPRAKPAVETQF